MQVGKEREKKAAAATATTTSRRSSSGIAALPGGKGQITNQIVVCFLLIWYHAGGGSDKSIKANILDDNNDPITLTSDEMKELEDLATKKADRSLTKDSMFCDVNFNLGSFRVDHLTATNPLTSLEMGMFLALFNANADGSFTSGLSLLSLEVKDSVPSFLPAALGNVLYFLQALAPEILTKLM